MTATLSFDHFHPAEAAQSEPPERFEGPGMNEAYYQLVKRHHQSSRGDFTQLFQTILSVADEIGLDDALRCLERCVIEKRLSWLGSNLEAQERTANPLADGYRIFYEVYLGISAPEDGEIVEATDGPHQPQPEVDRTGADHRRDDGIRKKRHQMRLPI